MKSAATLLTAFLPWIAAAESLSGVAKNQSGKILYTEHHEIQKDEADLSKFIQVQYKRPDGTTFATMTSDFAKNPRVPETTFEDLRFDTKITLRVLDSAVHFEEIRNKKPYAKKSIPLNDSMVASQGFDNFIKLNAEALNSKPLNFKFGVLEKKDFYSLTGYKKTSASPHEVEYGIRASSWLVRLFADELRVIYDAKTMRLKSFRGRSNILDDRGKPQDVTIDYQWEVLDK